MNKIPGFKTLREFAASAGLSENLVSYHMRQGWCAYPPRARTTDLHYGVAKHPLYCTWVDMVARCHDPKRSGFEYYGGRGIQVYESWRSSFDTFVLWVMSELGPRPDGYSLDRIDCSAGYRPGNLRWADRYTQAQNRGRNQNNTSGITGLSPYRSSWRVSIMRYDKLHQKQFKDRAKAEQYLRELLDEL